MAGDELLDRRIALLTARLRQLGELPAVLHNVNDSLSRELQILLAAETARLFERVSRLRSVEDPWDLLREIESDSEQLFSESLGFVGGGLARSAGLNEDLCQIAERLIKHVRDLGQLYGPSTVVLAEREFTHAMSRLVRLRFPGHGLWDLPVIIHELAHSIVDLPLATSSGNRDQMSMRGVVTEIASRGTGNPGFLVLSRSEEIFADVFATYVTGISYAYSCLRMRFSPADEGVISLYPTHPPTQSRVAAIVTTLSHLESARRDAGSIAGSFRPVLDDLLSAWSADLTRVSATFLDWDFLPAREYCDALDSSLPAIRRCDLTSAHAVSAALVNDHTRPASATLFDVLDGAWLARRRCETAGLSTESIASRAKAWCLELTHG